MAFYNYQTVTIANGATVSDAIDLQGHTVCGIIMPSAFTGASLAPSACQTVNGTYVPMYKDGSTISLTVSASKYVILQPADYAGIAYLKLTSGSAEAATRSLIVVSRTIG